MAKEDMQENDYTSNNKADNNNDKADNDYNKDKSDYNKMINEGEKNSKHHEKSSKHHKHKANESKKEKDDEDIKIDFGKVSGFFKKKDNKSHNVKHEKHIDKKSSHDTESESVSVDLSGFSAKAKKFLPMLLILIPLFLAVFIRIQPVYMPITHDWAENTVTNMIRSNVNAEVTRQYPNLPDATKSQIVDEKVKEILDKGIIDFNGQQVKIDDFIKQQAAYFKSAFSDNEHGHTYLLSIDPYYYYRQTKNYIDHGFEQDIINEEGLYCDTKILAGTPLELRQCSNQKVSNLHIYINVWTYDVWHFFDRNVDIDKAIFFTPLLISALCIIPAYFITRKFAGDFGGMFAGIIVAIHPIFMNRTVAGSSDTDQYGVFFPLLIFWFFIEAVYAKDWKKGALFAALGGLVTGIFALSWLGWFFIFNIVMVTLLAYFIFLIAVNWKKILSSKNLEPLKNDELKKVLIIGIVFMVSTAIFVSVFTTPQTIANLLTNTIAAVNLKQVGVTTIWPNVLTTVAELNPANLVETIDNISMGSKILLFLGFIGLVLSFIEMKTNETKSMVFLTASGFWYIVLIILYGSFVNMHLLYAILLSFPVIAWIIYSFLRGEKINFFVSLALAVWFVVTIYASSKGVRFIMLLVPAFAITSGIAAGVIQRKMSRWISRELNISKTITGIVVACLILLVLFFPVNAVNESYRQAKSEIPLINDQWYEALNKIKAESKPDAIINSWWDFGHWFIAIADRPVTLDGGRQSSPSAHWLGKLMLTSSEDESVGILRYLDCGQGAGFDTLNAYNQNDGLKTIKEINEIIQVSDKENAKKVLMSHGIAEKNATDVLKYTHCSPPENFFITSEDMVGKSGVWAHFGAWDFERASMYNTVHDKSETEGIALLKDKFGLNASEADKYYNEIITQDANYWIAPWPSYAGATSGQKTAEGKIQCNNGIVFDMNSRDASVQTQNGVMHPASISFINEKGRFEVVKYKENILTAQNGRTLGTAIVPSGDNISYTCILMDDELTASIFTRLFYFENMDGSLKHFKMFYNVRDITGQKIIVWKIDWDGKEDNKTQGSSVFNTN